MKKVWLLRSENLKMATDFRCSGGEDGFGGGVEDGGGGYPLWVSGRGQRQCFLVRDRWMDGLIDKDTGNFLKCY